MRAHLLGRSAFAAATALYCITLTNVSRATNNVIVTEGVSDYSYDFGNHNSDIDC